MNLLYNILNSIKKNEYIYIYYMNLLFSYILYINIIFLYYLIIKRILFT